MHVKKGTFSSDPVTPNLLRDANVYELGICDIRVSAGSLQIKQSNITDLRLNSDLCGIVTQTVNEIDTTTLYNQLQAHIEEKSIDMSTWIEQAKEYFSNWLSTTQTEYNDNFNSWFDEVKGTLEGDVAGNLLNKINELEEVVNNLDLVASKVTMSDGKTVQDAIDENKTSILEQGKEIESLKQNVDSAKSGIVGAIGSKALNDNSTFEEIKTQLQGKNGEKIWDILKGTSTANTVGSYLVGTREALSSALKSKGVSVTDAESLWNIAKKVEMLPYYRPVYGFDIDETNSNPDTCVTYTDACVGFTPLSCSSGTVNYGSWADTFIVKENKPCALSGGKRQFYLNPNNYAQKEDGTTYTLTSYDIMAEFPKAYYKLWKEGNKIKFRVSQFKIDDTYSCSAFISEDGNSQERDFMYIGTYLSTLYSSKARSISGRTPMSSYTIANARNYSTSNGTGYQQMTLNKLLYIQCLCVLVSKSLNSQGKFGYGVTNGTTINNGTMDTKGQFYGDKTSTNGVKVFHIENLWGNLFTFIDGLVVSNYNTKYKMLGGYNNTGSGYTNGNTVPTKGYINSMNCNAEGVLTPAATTGSSSTYYCDYLQIEEGDFILRFGGTRDSGSLSGLFYLNLNSKSSDNFSTTGCRLTYT